MIEFFINIQYTAIVLAAVCWYAIQLYESNELPEWLRNTILITFFTSCVVCVVTTLIRIWSTPA